MKIELTGNRERKGVGVGVGKGDNEKCVSFLFLRFCLFFGFFSRFVIFLARSPNCPK